MGFLTLLNNIKTKLLLGVIGFLIVTQTTTVIIFLKNTNEFKERIIDLKDEAFKSKVQLTALKSKLNIEALRFERKLAKTKEELNVLKSERETALDVNITKSMNNVPSVNKILDIPMIKITDNVCKDKMKETELYYRNRIKELKSIIDKYSKDNITELRRSI